LKEKSSNVNLIFWAMLPVSCFWLYHAALAMGLESQSNLIFCVEAMQFIRVSLV
jgi:hypothetical protein